jgi:arsenite methyltransferase
MSQLVFDEDIAKQMETLYRTRDVRRRRALVSEALAVHEGERVLDVGCGPGFYAEQLLDVVGAVGCRRRRRLEPADARRRRRPLRAPS